MDDKSKTWCDHFRKGRGWPNNPKRERRSERGLKMIMGYLNDTLLKYIFNVSVYTNCSEGTGYIFLLLYLMWTGLLQRRHLWFPLKGGPRQQTGQSPSFGWVWMFKS